MAKAAAAKAVADRRKASTKKPPSPVARKKAASWTDARRDRFIATLADTANVAAAARAARMSRGAAYAERKRNAQFASLWDAAINIALDELELSILERAMHGTDTAIVYHGEQRGTVKHYSDALAMFILRGRRKAIYGKDAEASAPQSEEDMRALIEARLAGLADGENGA